MRSYYGYGFLAGCAGFRVWTLGPALIVSLAFESTGSLFVGFGSLWGHRERSLEIMWCFAERFKIQRCEKCAYNLLV